MSDIKITDFIDFNPKRAVKKGEVAPFVDMAALPVDSRDISEIGEREFKGSGSKFINGDTLFARITPCLENGKTAKVSGLPEGIAASGSTEFIVMAAKEPDYDEDYVYYLARLPEFRSFAHARMEGTSGRQRVPWQSLIEFEFNFPEKKKRKEIGELLKTIDDKIELNRQTNQTLEHIAQAIFKSWFVDFEPTRAKIAAKQIGRARLDGERSAGLREALLSDGRWSEAIAIGDPERAAMAAISGKSLDELDQLSPEQQDQLKTTAALFPDVLVDSELGEIPEGWKISQLGEIIEFNPKRTLKKGELAPYLDMKNVPTNGHLAEDVYLREMASGTKFVNGDTLLARITPCLENGKTAYVDFLDEGQVAWGSTEYIVMRPKNGRPLSLGYLIARLDSFRAQAIQTMTGTSGRQRANAKALSEQLWLDYPLELLEVFDAYSSRYLEQARANGDENKSLAQLRDALLPQLLSGELNTEPNNREVA